jgi:hypothetical protein
VGTTAGLNALDRTTGRFTRYLNSPSNPRSLGNNRVLDIYEDSSGVLWVGTDGGLNALDRTTGRFTRYVNDPPRNSRVFRITPEIAAWVLETYNIENRPPKPNAIARFSDDMEQEAWRLTGDCLKFSNAHKLRDGQNRLRACVRSGKSFSTHVVFGVPDSAFDRMDRGKPRSGGDVLAIAGFSNAGVLAGAVRHVRNLTSDTPTQREGMEPYEALNLIREQYPDLPMFMASARAIRVATGQPIAPVAAMLYIFAQKNRARADEFATGWASGKHVGRFAAIGTLEKAFSKLRAEAMGRVHETARFAYIITAWNLYLQGNKGRLPQFQWQQGDRLPEIMG